MPKNSPVGLDFAEAAAEAMAELADLDESPASDDTVAPKQSRSEHEHPTVGESKDDENVGLLSSLYEAEETDDEHPEEDSTFTIDGKQVTLNELRKSYMRQSDYTQKTQELATLREEAKNALQLWDAFQKDPRGTLGELQRRINMGQVPTGSPVKPAEDVEALVEKRVRELLSEHPSLKQVETQVETDKQARMFETIEKDYTVKLNASDRKFVLDKAQTLGVTDPDGVRLIVAGLLQEAQRKEAERKVRSKASTASGRFSGPGEDDEIDEEITDFYSAARAAAKSLGLEELLNR